eukprot:jgi/Bigna1/72555/fgenesh1_pg.20_\
MRKIASSSGGGNSRRTTTRRRRTPSNDAAVKGKGGVRSSSSSTLRTVGRNPIAKSRPASSKQPKVRATNRTRSTPTRRRGRLEIKRCCLPKEAWLKIAMLIDLGKCKFRIWRILYSARFKKQPQREDGTTWKNFYEIAHAKSKHNKISSAWKRYEKHIRSSPFPSLRQLYDDLEPKFMVNLAEHSSLSEDFILHSLLVFVYILRIARRLSSQEKAEYALGFEEIKAKTWVHEGATCVKILLPENVRFDNSTAINLILSVKR